ncbi:MAG: cation-transporting P-type ATPase [Candidatus Pacearchaeota archaeon]
MEKSGLTKKEARILLEKYGYNELKEVNKKTPLKILFNQVKANFVIYLLIFAMILSFIVEKNLTGFVILGVIVIVITTGFIQEYRADKAIKALKEMILPATIVIRDGKEKEIPSKELVPGDIIILRSGEKIPADCLILEEKNLLVNESILTGESKEVSKKATKNEEDYKEENVLFMGSFIVEGKCIAKVLHTGMNTKFGKIANLISTTEKELPLQKKMNRIAKRLAIFGITFSLLTALMMILKAPQLTNERLIEAMIIAVAVAVASFPEGFPVVLITSLSTGAYRMAKKNAIVNRMSVIETLGETTVICSDKTGTITKGEMTVKKILTDGKIFDVSGVGYEGHGDFFLEKEKINPKKERVLMKLIETGVYCNDALIERTGEDKEFKIIGSPTEASLLVLASKIDLYKEDIKGKRIEEIPFNSSRKIMSVLQVKDKEKIIYTKGAVEILIEKCKFIERKDGIFRMTEKEKKKILEINKEFNSEAYRTLGLAYKPVKTNTIKEEDLIFLGIVAIEDPPKPEVAEAIRTCKQAGIKVKMITGDNKETAISIGDQIGLSGKVIEGKELEKLTEEELSKIVGEIVIFARVKPEHKLKIVKALKMNGEIVTMTGDGVNDAPSLKEAHIGVAMGKAGTDVSREVADITLKDDNFATIVEAIKEGRTIFSNIQKFTTYQISINFSQVMLIFLAILLNLPAPLVAIQILFMNLFSDEITAITLAFNPYSHDVVNHKPRKKSEIITGPLFFMMVLAGIIMSLGSLAMFYYVLQKGKEEIAARTITFATMVFFGITNAFNFRSFRKTSLNRSPFTNKPLFFASLFAIIITILTIYNPLFNKIFETTPIKTFYLFFGIITSLSVLIVFDILKYINNKKNFWTENMQEFVKRKN